MAAIAARSELPASPQNLWSGSPAQQKRLVAHSSATARSRGRPRRRDAESFGRLEIEDQHKLAGPLAFPAPSPEARRAPCWCRAAARRKHRGHQRRRGCLPRARRHRAHEVHGEQSQSRVDRQRFAMRWRASLRRDRWILDEIADAEIGHVRDGLGAMIVTEFGSGFLASVHSCDSSAARVMGSPLGDIVNFS